LGNVNTSALKHTYSPLSEAQPPLPDLQLAAYSPGKNGVPAVVFKKRHGHPTATKEVGGTSPPRTPCRDCVEIVRRLDAPIAWPHTVIFMDRGVAERLRPAVAPRIVYNFTYSGFGVWGSPASVLGGHLWGMLPVRASWRRA